MSARVSPNLSNTGKHKHSSADQRVSTCTDCKYGIFTFHEYVWTSRGLVHTKCNDKERQDEVT